MLLVLLEYLVCTALATGLYWRGSHHRLVFVAYTQLCIGALLVCTALLPRTAFRAVVLLAILALTLVLEVAVDVFVTPMPHKGLVCWLVVLASCQTSLFQEL
jgi:hypothetical protein